MSRRIPASASSNQGLEKADLIPLFETLGGSSIAARIEVAYQPSVDQSIS